MQVSTAGPKRFRRVFEGRSTGKRVLPLERISASTRALVRVIVSDGFNSGVSRTRPFVSRGTAPTLRVEIPSADGPVAAGARLYASAYAFDDRVRHLGGDALRWSVDGRRVARGTTVGLPALRAGAHTVTVVARDARGRTRTSRTTVRVSRR